MGLDIYVERCKDLKAAKKLEDLYEAGSSKIWGNKKWEAMSKQERDEASKKCDELSKSLKLGKYGSAPTRAKIEKNSKKHPKHLFKIGYFRSSYNDGGINRVLERLDIGDLYYIFDYQKEQYEFRPDWEEALKRVDACLDAFGKIKNKDYDVFCVEAQNIFTPDTTDYAKDEKEALKVFQKQQEKPHAFDGGYSCREGDFYPKGRKCLGFVKGTRNIIGKTPAIYVIYESKNSFKWYIEALEVVKETIEYVLSQKDKDDYYMSWSG